MPRRYRRRYRRKPQSKSSYYLDKAGKALSVAYAVKRLVNVERKKADFAGNSSIGTTLTEYFHISAVAQGDGRHQREGNSFKATSIQAKYTITKAAAGDVSYLRLLLVQDNQQVANTAPTVASILADSTSYVSLLNPDTLGRYSILMDRTVCLSDTGTQGTVGSINIPMQHHVKYNGSLSTNIQRGGLYLYAISSDNTNKPSVNIMGRLSYIDN